MLDEMDYKEQLDECFPLLELDLSGLDEDQDGADEVGRMLESEDIARLQPVLICLGGQDASSAAARCLRHGPEVYLLDAPCGTVAKAVMFGGAAVVSEQFQLDRYGEACRLPKFRLLICGCDAFHADGYVYSASCEFKEQYDLLRRLGKVTTDTFRVVVASEDQMVQMRCGDTVCLLRAHARLGDDGITGFGWKPDSNFRVSAGSGGRSKKRKTRRRRRRS